MKTLQILFAFALALGSSAFAQPRAPIDASKAEAVVVPGPGFNLVRNGSFEGSTKYATSEGEWRDPDAFVQVDGNGVVGKFCLRKPKSGGVQIAPFHAKPNALYCLSFYARGDAPTGNDWEINVRHRLMHWIDKSNFGYDLRSGERLTREWKRFHVFFVANRRTELKAGPEIANSYMLWFWSGVGERGTLWLDGVQVEEVPLQAANLTPQDAQTLTWEQTPTRVAGFPTSYKSAAPVEVCAETVNLPFTGVFGAQVAPVARVRAAIANDGTPRTVRVSWTLLTHRRQPLWRSPVQTRALQAGEVWSPVQDVRLSRKGALLVRCEVRDAKNRALNYSDEPVTRLPFDLSRAGSAFEERFGAGGGFVDAKLPATQNKALQIYKRIGFRWVRTVIENPRRGQDDAPVPTWDWTRADAEVAWCRANGLRNKAVVGEEYPKPFQIQGKRGFPYYPPSDMNWDASDPRWDDLTIQTSLDRFLRELARRYKGRIDALEYGVETTHGTVEDPDKVFRLCRRATKIIKSIDPDVKIIGANTLWLKTDYWERVIELGGLADMDYFGWDFDCYTYAGTTYDDIMRVRNMMRAKGKAEVPLFNTETGWGSGWMQDYSADPLGTGRIEYAVIPDLMVKCFAQIFSANSTHFVLHHAAYQRNGMGDYGWYSSWPVQLYDEQERPRVTLAAYNVAAKYLGLSTPHGRVVRGDYGLEAYVFQDKREARPVAVLWSSSESAPSSKLPLRTSARLEYADVMGNEHPLATVNGIASAPLPEKGRPVYLLGPRGMTANQMRALFAKLPALPVHAPTFAKDAVTGRDRLNGRWRLLHARQDGLGNNGKLQEIAYDADAGKNLVWARSLNDGAKLELGAWGWGGPNPNAGGALFSPSKAGTFRVELEAHADGGPDNTSRLFVAVLKTDGTLRQLFDGKHSYGRMNVDALTSQGITLGQGESLLFASHRAHYHHVGGVHLLNLRVRRAAQRS